MPSDRDKASQPAIGESRRHRFGLHPFTYGSLLTASAVVGYLNIAPAMHHYIEWGDFTLGEIGWPETFWSLSIRFWWDQLIVDVVWWAFLLIGVAAAAELRLVRNPFRVSLAGLVAGFSATAFYFGSTFPMAEWIGWNWEARHRLHFVFLMLSTAVFGLAVFGWCHIIGASMSWVKRRWKS